MEKKSVLLVEDDAPVREMIKDALETKYFVLPAEGFSEAIKQSSNRIDLALIDYNLPDGDGLELSKTIKKDRPVLPIIIMTGYGSEDLAINAIWTGVTGYIKKPFRLSHLMLCLSEIFGEQKRQIKTEFASPENRKDFLMDGVAEHINNRYSERLTLDNLARMAHMNKSHFCREYKKRHGMTCMSYIGKVRAEKGAALLRTSDLKVSDIVRCVGFGCIRYFNLVFRKVYKMTPAEYRKSCLKSKK